MRFLIFGAVLALGLPAGAALAADPPASAERLVVAPYPGGPPWQVVTDKRNEMQAMVEIIPPDQTVDAIKDIIVEQTFFQLKGQDPSAFLDGLIHRLAHGCADARINGPKAGTQNGYAVAYAQTYCVGVKGQDVDSMLKAISGKDALYVIQREFHRPATPGAKAGLQKFDSAEQARSVLGAQQAANDFLVHGVQLCPIAGSDAPCPSVAQPLPPDTIPPFVNGTSTVKDVQKKYGNPTTQDHNPDGRHVYTYVLPNGVILTFLFDKDDVLIRGRAYARKAP